VPVHIITRHYNSLDKSLQLADCVFDSKKATETLPVRHNSYAKGKNTQNHKRLDKAWV